LNTLDYQIKGYTNHIPETILSRKWQEKLLSVSNICSPFNSSNYIFETHLHSPKPSIDFAFTIEKKDIANIITNLQSSEMLKSSVWKNIWNFFSNWKEENSKAHRYIDYIWFEFDIMENMPDIPEPVIFIHFKKDIYQNNKIDYKWIFDILSVISGNTIEEKILYNIETCFLKLFASGKINYIGYMPSRKENALRVSIVDFSKDEIFQYLKKIELNHHSNDLKKSLQNFTGGADSLRLLLDVDEIIESKIGIEIHFNNIYKRQQEWNSILQNLLNCSHLDEKKIKSLIAWTEETRNIDIPEDSTFKTYSFLNHLKAVYHPNVPLEVKAYAGFFNVQKNIS